MEKRSEQDKGKTNQTTACNAPDRVEKESADTVKLQESEARLKTLFDHFPVSILIHDKDTGAIIDANRATLNAYGFQSLEALQKSDIWLDAPYSAEEALEHIHKAARDEDHSFEWKNRRLSGEVFWEQVFLRRITLNGVERVLATCIDISKRKQAEDEIRLQAQILENVNEAIIATDLLGHILHWGKGAEKMFGYNSEEVAGRPYLDFAGLVDYQDDHKLREKILKEGTYSGEHRHRRGDGTLFWTAVHISLLRDKEGQAVGFIGMDHDITERKMAEQKLLEANHQLEAAIIQAQRLTAEARAASRAKSDFLANMSHEIRTPLNGIIGMTELLQDGPLTKEQNRCVEMAKTSGESLLAIINDILDFSKIEAHKLDLETLDFDLHELLDETAAAMLLKADKKKIQLKWEITPSVPERVRGDPSRLRQVLNNLVGNAIKFTDEGSVQVNVKTERSKRSGKSEEPAQVHFSVADTGIGIPAKKQPLLFQHFSQVDSSHTRKHGGTGLGLAISKQLVELMGGAIGVESEEGKGSTFWFTLPLLPAAGVKRDPNGRTKPSDPQLIKDKFAERAVKILLAEDNRTNQIVALTLLSKMGLTARVAGDGLETVEALQQETFDLILMDVQMPNFDGLEATRNIRALDIRDSAGHPIPIVAMTAHALQKDKEACRAAGMNDYLAKPITSNSLALVLEKWLGPSSDHGPSSQATAAVNQSSQGAPDTSFSNWNRQALLHRFMGDEALLRSVMQCFLDETPARLTELRNGAETSDFALIYEQAHKIKGSASNVMAGGIADLASAIEAAAVKQNKAIILDAIKRLDTSVGALKESCLS